MRAYLSRKLDGRCLNFFIALHICFGTFFSYPQYINLGHCYIYKTVGYIYRLEIRLLKKIEY